MFDLLWDQKSGRGFVGATITEGLPRQIIEEKGPRVGFEPTVEAYLRMFSSTAPNANQALPPRCFSG